jgi:hypothetical protein
MLCLKNQGQNNFKWINYIESILNRAGLGYIVINQFGYCDKAYLHQILRFCTLCGQSIGDEFHLLFVCCNEYLVNMRRIYLPRYYVTYMRTYHIYSVT